MQIVQAVFGVFHHFELAHQLQQRGHLRRIFSTWPWARLKREGLPRSLVGTFPLLHTADYLLNRTNFYPAALSTRMNRWNAIMFDHYTRRAIPQCDAFIAISGAGLLTGQRVQRRGGKFICDRGSTHQRFQQEVVRAEYQRWDLPLPELKPHVLEREERIYSVADAITVPSSVARRSFLRMGVPAEKVHVIPYGVRLDKFLRTTPPPSDRFEVLFAGQVGVRKGVPDLLEAFARVRHPRKRLTLVGTVLGHIRPLLRRLPLQNVEITGPLPQHELIERMGRSHVLVLPSIEEGLALVQAQAMACQCPVIATAATGAEDLFTDGVEGYILPERVGDADLESTVDGLADRMQQLADYPALQQQFAVAALARVRLLGGWDAYGSRWDSFLHELTGSPKDSAEAAS